jgi:2-oxoisovalerate dehydrogenase E2 component (dihydrolipoyl transacylase)
MSVAEDQIVADVMTDKATVEITAPVSGKVLALHGEPGAMVPVRGPLVEFEIEGAGNADDAPTPVAPTAAKPDPAPVSRREGRDTGSPRCRGADIRQLCLQTARRR